MFTEYEAARLRHPSSGGAGTERSESSAHGKLVDALEDLAHAMDVRGRQSREAAEARSAVMSASDLVAESWRQRAAA